MVESATSFLDGRPLSLFGDWDMVESATSFLDGRLLFLFGNWDTSISGVPVWPLMGFFCFNFLLWKQGQEDCHVPEPYQISNVHCPPL
jgi:hypothetical protein